MEPCSNISIQKRPQLSIQLENPSKVFFAGEMVRGTAVFEAECNQQVQVLSVYLRGEYFFERRSIQQVEKIFMETSPVDYRGAGEGNVEMEFCLVLRPNLHMSLATPLGGIRYQIFSSLIYKKDEKLESLEASEDISVNCKKPLPEDFSGRRMNGLERGGLLCCIGTISADMEIGRVFLLCGHAVVVNGSVFNGTHSSVFSTMVSLVQIVVRQRDHKKSKRYAVTKQKGGILPGKKQEWLAETFLVPPLPPTSANPFFRVSYRFLMEVEKANGSYLKLKIPVVIGNIAPRVGDLPSNSLGSLQKKEGHEIECKCSVFDESSQDFKPKYVNYVT